MIDRLIQRLHFLILAWRAFTIAEKNKKPVYIAATDAGVPFIALFVALEREAWRISVTALENLR